MSRTDAAFAAATHQTAERLSQASAGGAYLLERFNPKPKRESAFLQPLFNEALATQKIGSLPVSEPRPELPNWEPNPGGVDVAATRDDGSLRCVGEMKLRDSDQALWDLFKMLDALTLDGVEAAYLVVGASDKAWARTTDACSEIFTNDSLEDYSSLTLFENNKSAWRYLLDGGVARPTSIPSHFSTRFIASEPLLIDGASGSLKCIAVENSGSTRIDFSLEWFHGNWPVGIEPCRRYFDRLPWWAGRGQLLYGVPLKRRR